MSEAKLWIQCARKYMFGFLWGMGWVKCKDFSSKHWDSNCQRWELCPEKIGTWWFTAIQCLMGSKPNRLPICSLVSNLWIHVFCSRLLLSVVRFGAAADWKLRRRVCSLRIWNSADIPSKKCDFQEIMGRPSMEEYSNQPEHQGLLFLAEHTC